MIAISSISLNEKVEGGCSGTGQCHDLVSCDLQQAHKSEAEHGDVVQDTDLGPMLPLQMSLASYVCGQAVKSTNQST